LQEVGIFIGKIKPEAVWFAGFGGECAGELFLA